MLLNDKDLYNKVINEQNDYYQKYLSIETNINSIKNIFTE
jgi:hypothetical protein